MTTAADVLNVARSYIGVVEDPPHSNNTVIGDKFGWNGVPWCAEFVSVCEREAGLSFSESASCSRLIARYQDGTNGTWGVDPQPGDEGFLGSSGGDHTFLVEANTGDGWVTTIEGNWSDRVARVRRTISSIYGFGRPNYEVAAVGQPAPPSQTGGRPVLREGSTGQAVVEWQKCLVIPADGIFGPQTTAATKAFQAKLIITVDGEVGPETYAAMDRVLAYLAAAAEQPASDAPSFQATVQRGSRGSTVRAVQQQLEHRGWKIAVDGDFGAQTEQVVKAFQNEKGLGVDGIVGPVTWNALWTAPL